MIVIPADSQDDRSARIVVDLGCFELSTNKLVETPPPPGFQTKNMMEKPPMNTPCLSLLQNKNDINSLFYDIYTARFSRMQVLWCPAGALDAWRSADIVMEQSLHLIDRFDIEVKIKSSLLPSDPTITRCLLDGTISGLKFRCSMEKYYSLSSILYSFNQQNKMRRSSSATLEPILTPLSDEDDNETWFSVENFEQEDIKQQIREVEMSMDEKNERKKELEQELIFPPYDLYLAAELAEIDSYLTSLQNELDELKLTTTLETVSVLKNVCNCSDVFISNKNSVKVGQLNGITDKSIQPALLDLQVNLHSPNDF